MLFETETLDNELNLDFCGARVSEELTTRGFRIIETPVLIVSPDILTSGLIESPVKGLTL